MKFTMNCKYQLIILGTSFELVDSVHWTLGTGVKTVGTGAWRRGGDLAMHFSCRGPRRSRRGIVFDGEVHQFKNALNII